MAPALLVLLLLGVAGIVLGVVDFNANVAERVDWGYVGLGAAAFMAFAFLANPGLASRARSAARRLAGR